MSIKRRSRSNSDERSTVRKSRVTSSVVKAAERTKVAKEQKVNRKKESSVSPTRRRSESSSSSDESVRRQCNNQSEMHRRVNVDKSKHGSDLRERKKKRRSNTSNSRSNSRQRHRVRRRSSNRAERHRAVNVDRSTRYRRESRESEKRRRSKSSESRSNSRKRHRYNSPPRRNGLLKYPERKRSNSKDEIKNRKDENENHNPPGKRTKNTLPDVLTRAGGAYIPPAKLKAMQSTITDKSSADYQRISWEALKKSIHGLVNKVSSSNVVEISTEMFRENIVRGRGLLVKSLMQTQSSSHIFTSAYASLVSVINSKIPQIGELLLTRLILQFKRGFKRNAKNQCLSSTKFIAHMFNQNIVHEALVLQILILLLDKPTNDSIEVAVGFLKECGQKLSVISPTCVNSVFDMLRSILNESDLEIRVMYMIEVMFAIRKDGYKDHPAVLETLDLVEIDDQFIHMMTLEDELNSDDRLNVFKVDPQYEENEEKYKEIKKEILGEGSSDEEEDGGSEGDSEDEESSDGETTGDGKMIIEDQTETNMVTLRRTIYLTVQSSVNFEECAHKLLKLQLKPGQETELCHMIMDCAAQLRTYEKFYGLLAQRLCLLKKIYVESYEEMFKEQYDTVHRLEIVKLRNVTLFFAYLLYSDSISWEVMKCIKLNEYDTTSSSRIFIKILFQELAAYMGNSKLKDRLGDVTLQTSFEGLFPKDNTQNTRFSINFFTSIGLGGLTEDLRAHLENTKKIAQKSQLASDSSSSEEDSDSD